MSILEAVEEYQEERENLATQMKENKSLIEEDEKPQSLLNRKMFGFLSISS